MMTRFRRLPTSSRRAGISLIEVMLAMGVISVAVVGTVGTIAATAKLSSTDEETILAAQGARVMLEQMSAADFDEVFALYNESAADDPAGAGTGPGAYFDVPGLDLQVGDADGRVGQILFPVPPGFPASLRENTVDPTFAMPRDLNLDGVEDANEHSGDYLILPVRVRVDWRGMNGDRSVSFDTILTSR